MPKQLGPHLDRAIRLSYAKTQAQRDAILAEKVPTVIGPDKPRVAQPEEQRCDISRMALYDELAARGD